MNRKIIVLGCTIIMIFLSFEIGFRTNIFGISPGSFMDPYGFSSYAKNRDGGLEGIGMIDPILGYKLKPDLLMKDHMGSHVSTNSQGVRALEEKDGGGIICIGDSFTFGEGVEDDETYPYMLQQMTDIEVVNLGVFAYGFDQMLVMQRTKADSYDPKDIIIGYWHDDSNRVMYRFYSGPKPTFNIGHDGLIYNPPPTYRLHTTYYLETLKNHLRDTFFREDKNKYRLKLSRDIIMTMIAEARIIGAEAHLLYFPELHEIEQGLIEDTFFLSLCENIDCINPISNMNSYMQEHEGPFVDEFQHFRPEMNRIIAEVVADHLTK